LSPHLVGAPSPSCSEFPGGRCTGRGFFGPKFRAIKLIANFKACPQRLAQLSSRTLRAKVFTEALRRCQGGLKDFPEPSFYSKLEFVNVPEKSGVSLLQSGAPGAACARKVVHAHELSCTRCRQQRHSPVGNSFSGVQSAILLVADPFIAGSEKLCAFGRRSRCNVLDQLCNKSLHGYNELQLRSESERHPRRTVNVFQAFERPSGTIWLLECSRNASAQSCTDGRRPLHRKSAKPRFQVETAKGTGVRGPAARMRQPSVRRVALKIRNRAALDGMAA